MYLNSHNEYECSGCAACYSVCNHTAITMEENGEGFLFPVRHADKCIGCGLCEKVCPIEHSVYNNTSSPQVYAAFDPKERKMSSSGGLFYTIAKYVIEQNGVVFGATYDENLQVRHVGVERLSDLENLRGSKYVQSYIEETFREAKRYLKEGRYVYFTGTPCQIAGLKAYLRKDYKNLITTDIVCHGVPSRKFFNQHLYHLGQKYGSKVTNYSFRDTRFWLIREKIQLENGKVFCQHDGNRSPYLYAFGLGITYRYSCFACKFAHIPRQGDITLADYWGIGRFHPEVDNRVGVSLVLLNSSKGIDIWNKIKRNLKYVISTMDACTVYNPNVIRPTKQPKGRQYFFSELERVGYDGMAATVLACPADLQNKHIERIMRLRSYGLVQSLDFCKLLIKRVLLSLHLYGLLYNLYNKLKSWKK